MITLGLIYLAVAVSGFFYAVLSDDIVLANSGVSQYEPLSVRRVPLHVRIMIALVTPPLFVAILMTEYEALGRFWGNSWSIIVLGLRPTY